MSAAVTAMVTCVALTNVTVRAVPLNVPVAPLTKLLPLIVKLKAAPPTVALEGESELRVAAGLVTLKDSELEAPPPGAGLLITTGKEPAAAMSAAMLAVGPATAVRQERINGSINAEHAFRSISKPTVARQ